MSRRRDGEAIQAVDEIDMGELVKSAGGYAVGVAKNRPVGVSLWVIGLLVAAFAKGFAVSDEAQQAYTVTLQHAAEVDRKELLQAHKNTRAAEDRYYNAKGWFWTCDDRCQKAKDKYDMARADFERVQRKKEQIMREAKAEVGIWSVFGVRDVRASFWDAWQSGKDFAARYTMMDAMMMMFSGEKETMVSVILKLAFQYIVNLTMGLIGAMVFFIVNVYYLIVSYGETTLSGLAFFLLVVVATLATVGTYLVAIFGTFAGAGIFIVKQAAKQEIGDRRGERPRRVQYNSGGRAHYD
eukprot:TRINITY_DN20406_c2_g1_i2.p1 TRINITY_DN20406_c2_g1~~TRINITY_DN20406_c2_g1_i2.p1  ORF type:complete len:330 (-),score=60.40 TRINITY_DN20406_c2_g1_i2:89-976(-)